MSRGQNLMHHREVQSLKNIGVTLLLQRIKPHPPLYFRNVTLQRITLVNASQRIKPHPPLYFKKTSTTTIPHSFFPTSRQNFSKAFNGRKKLHCFKYLQTSSEAYLVLSQRCMMELFCENS